MCIEHGASNTRALLGSSDRPHTVTALKYNYKPKHYTQTESTQQNDSKYPKKTIISVPARPYFDFKDYLRKKDQRQFDILIDQPKKCTGPKGAPYLLIAIKSMAADFDKRQIVRQTWGREGVAKSGSIMTVFLLGVPPNVTNHPHWDTLLAYEGSIFKDILLWDFKDTFFNLTLKETHFLQWVNTSCNEAKFIFKGDADVYMNIENLLQMLDDEHANEDLFVGDIIVHARPIRRRNSKYFVPEFIYGQGIYPAYAGGGGFVMSGHTALRLHMACKEVELFPIDDVFLGMCLLRIGVKLSRHMGFRTFGIERPSAAPHLEVFDPCFYRELIVVHSLTVPEIWLMWNLLHDPSVRCHISQGSTVLPFQWGKEVSPRDKIKDIDYANGLPLFVTH